MSLRVIIPERKEHVTPCWLCKVLRTKGSGTPMNTLGPLGGLGCVGDQTCVCLHQGQTLGVLGSVSSSLCGDPSASDTPPHTCDELTGLKGKQPLGEPWAYL